MMRPTIHHLARRLHGAGPASGDRPPPDAVAPSLRRMIGEFGVFTDYVRNARRPFATDPARGRGRLVVVLPGFMIDDARTRHLRAALRGAGYAADGWGMGRNLGATADMIDRLETLLLRTGQGHPVAVVGWSLGGVFAREIAHRRPDLVERVVTLGAPFSGNPRANNAWRMYERIAGHPVDAPPVIRNPAPKPPVRTIAVWSRRDGVVAPASARGRPDETDQTIEVDCLHCGFAVNPRALAAVLDALEA